MSAKVIKLNIYIFQVKELTPDQLSGVLQSIEKNRVHQFESSGNCQFSLHIIMQKIKLNLLITASSDQEI